MNPNFEKEVTSNEPRKGSIKFHYCQWFYKDIPIFQERIFNLRKVNSKSPPAHIFNATMNLPSSEYWADGTYHDLNKATSDAQKYGARVCKDFYCDDNDLTFFLIFNDFNKVILYAYEQLLLNKILIDKKD